MCQCDLKTKNGLCNKHGGRYKCRPTTSEDFDEPVEMIDVDRVCRKCSIFGNSLCYITEEQLRELMAGKAIYFSDDEYGWFLILKNEEK